ncbi:MAG: hypothetical protein KA120_01715 [Candidatus Goldbacteria bacterium]|nr:hypothetical protein [Candidatus Goldiibacteriota bacterium]
MAQLHKKFTEEQVKDLLTRYSKGEIERKYLQEIMGIGKSRFFALVKEYRKNPEHFSIQYERTDRTRQIYLKIEKNILKELTEEKKLIDNNDMPIKNYNYSYIRDILHVAESKRRICITVKHKNNAR